MNALAYSQETVSVRRARADVDLQRTLLGEAIDEAPVFVFVADGEGRYVAVNRHACQVLGYSRKQLARGRRSRGDDVDAGRDPFEALPGPPAHRPPDRGDGNPDRPPRERQGRRELEPLQQRRDLRTTDSRARLVTRPRTAAACPRICGTTSDAVSVPKGSADLPCFFCVLPG